MVLSWFIHEKLCAVYVPFESDAVALTTDHVPDAFVVMMMLMLWLSASERSIVRYDGESVALVAFTLSE